MSNSFDSPGSIAHSPAATEVDPYTDFKEIEKRSSIDSQDFKTNFLTPCRPVVFTELVADWPALNKWTVDFFKSKCGDLDVKTIDNKFYGQGSTYMSAESTLRFDEYLSMISTGTSDLRLFALNPFKKFPWLLKDFNYPKILSDNKLVGKPRFFLGTKGCETLAHYDIDMVHNLHTNLKTFDCEKIFILFPPEDSRFLYRHPFTIRSYINPLDVDHEKYPGFKNAQGYIVRLQPGETIFVPCGWWHYVTYTGPSAAISYRIRNEHFVNRLKAVKNLGAALIDILANKAMKEHWYNWKENTAIKNASM